MKRVALIASLVLLVLLAVAAIAPFLIPGEVYRAQIERSATNALGRDVTLTGNAGLSLLPQLSARVEGVTVANPEGFSRPNMIEAGELRGVVKWAPLLSGRVEIAELVFADADVKLERLESGDVNWTFSAGDEAPPDPDGGSTGGGVQAGIDRASLQNARLVYTDAQAGLNYELADLDLTARMPALDRELVTRASGTFQGSEFDLDLDLNSIEALLSGAEAVTTLSLALGDSSVGYDGNMTLGDAPELSGTFSLDARDLSALAALAGVDPGMNLAALGRMRASGRVDGPLDTAELTFDTLSIGGEGLDLSYSGAVTLGEALSLAGRFSAESRDMSDWLDGLGLDLPPATAILDAVDIEAQLSGPVETLSLTEISGNHSGDLLDASFNGAVSLGGAGQFNGTVNASSDQLRPLMTQLGVELAPGETLQSFSLNGGLGGTFETINFQNLTGRLDDVELTGTGSAALAGARPVLTGDFTAGTLDLSPFLGTETASDQPANQPQGWSDAPLNLDGLSAVDAELSLKADEIILGDIALTAPDLAADLRGGALTANIAALQTLGGQWSGVFGLDASGETPRMQIDMRGDTIELNQTLLSLADLNAFSGLGTLRVDVQSQGNSIKALVEGLRGDIATDVENGQLRGINIGQIARSRENVLEALASGQLQLALEPEAETDFTSMLAGLTVENGIARLDAFEMISPVLTLEGGGEINLAAQTLNVSIVPTLDTSGQAGGTSLQLNNVPIPFRISGNWLSPGISPDMQMLTRIVQQDATARIRDEITDQIGGDVGGVLGQILGTGQSAEPAPAPPPSEEGQANATPVEEPAEDPAARDPEDLVRDAARDAARDALGGLFGRRDEPEPEPAPEDPPQ